MRTGQPSLHVNIAQFQLGRDAMKQLYPSLPIPIRLPGLIGSKMVTEGSVTARKFIDVDISTLQMSYGTLWQIEFPSTMQHSAVVETQHLSLLKPMLHKQIDALLDQTCKAAVSVKEGPTGCQGADGLYAFEWWRPDNIDDIIIVIHSDEVLLRDQMDGQLAIVVNLI
eukprot:TRINITY_DN12229_c5_g2_i2.p2 TRINITY_DN12229_c5_g2~~TRINITY_DN12229_c5_g2_i2.p2  ORF type:complete len:168 (-),score=18.80 TRINITY_DN12229_c5_g2_i2:135-638(-)